MMLPWNMKSFIKILEISLTHINIQTLVTIIKNKKKTIVVRVTAQILFGKRIPLNTIIGDISSNSKKKMSHWVHNIFGESLPELEKLFHLIHRNAWNNYRIWKKYTLKYTRLGESIIWIRKCTEGLFQESL